ncbi:hypothetical protein MBLNU230_g0159t1 [Neophaeotheca triangularis]
MATEAQLDHVILLLPYKDIIDPPAWLTNNFTISPGGRHADGKTENRLILFRDGTYLELIAFINDDPEKRRGHWWDKPYGIVDYALTSASPLDFKALKSRLNATDSQVSYQDPLEGGRERPDGTRVQWKVTFPTGTERGTVPFWCHDLTPREARVPLTEASTTHPSGALGMAGIREAVITGRAGELGRALAAILGQEATAGDQVLEREFEVGVPQKVDGARAPSLGLQRLPDGAERGLFLTLLLQGTDGKVGEDIEESIAGGVVSIKWTR